MSTGADDPGATWLAGHSWHRPTWTMAELVAAKAGRTISVVLPAWTTRSAAASRRSLSATLPK